ncbi:hypothetical protein GIY23_01145 [Allosaccharopolyspora coralli]|uniref:DUF397 domain-containing protein n=1 Tax=Allosaccharopolyspora coralli TaxID=2665642 RepID=A0A5Q3Q1E2_9PSEU|nr:hypothetical protein [Allosaccharopolyspora coralli]QGK68351.1 hypothetical protein GIY23_01145 [Allosaccharopolyspora coralli]
MWPTEDTPTTSTENLRWQIDCVNEAGRPRSVSVLVMGDRVAMVLPPGVTIVLTPDEARDFSDFLTRSVSLFGAQDH